MSLRTRLMLVAAATVAMALAVAGVALYLLTARGTNSSLDAAARQTAEQVAALGTEGDFPDPLPSAGTQLVQVVDAQNRVLSASITAGSLTPLADESDLIRLRSGDVVVVSADRVAQSGQLRLVGRAIPGERTVVVASATSAVETGRGILLRRMVLILPLVLGGVLILAWRMIDSALTPVEQLRRGAARIGSGARGVTEERLPVPTTQDEIAALANTLNDMLDRLWQSQERQRAFVADAAHELRSPLSGVRTELEVSQRLGEGGDLPYRLLPELERLSALVDDLLLLARVGSTPTERASALELAPFLSALADRYGDARVPVLVDVSARETVLADGADLLRVMTNLVDNAVRHATHGVRVEVTAERAGEAPVVRVSVIDDGAGIRPEDRERVFDRFARLDEARDRDSGGSGLGLAIARALVRRYGGDIQLTDARPGVRAEVMLPSATLENASELRLGVGGRSTPLSE